MHAAEFGVKYLLISYLLIFHSQVDSEGLFWTPWKRSEELSYFSFFEDEKNEAEKSKWTCPGSHSWLEPMIIQFHVHSIGE